MSGETLISHGDVRVYKSYGGVKLHVKERIFHNIQLETN